MDKDLLLIDNKATTNEKTMLDIDSNKWLKVIKSKMNFIQIKPSIDFGGPTRMDKTHRMQISLHKKDKF